MRYATLTFTSMQPNIHQYNIYPYKANIIVFRKRIEIMNLFALILKPFRLFLTSPLYLHRWIRSSSAPASVSHSCNFPSFNFYPAANNFVVILVSGRVVFVFYGFIDWSKLAKSSDSHRKRAPRLASIFSISIFVGLWRKTGIINRNGIRNDMRKRIK